MRAHKLAEVRRSSRTIEDSNIVSPATGPDAGQVFETGRECQGAPDGDQIGGEGLPGRPKGKPLRIKSRAMPRPAGSADGAVESRRPGRSRSQTRAPRAEPIISPADTPPIGLFDEAWYRRQAGAIDGSAYEHYLREGISRGISPSVLFDVTYYAKAYPGTDFHKVNPVQHYIAMPVAERGETHLLFDRQFYLKAEPAIPAGVDPLFHMLTDASARRRATHPLFDSAFYLDSNPDVAASDMLPLQHFLFYGYREDRNPHPLFDIRYYRATQPGLSDSDNPLVHYLVNNTTGNQSPHPLFDPNWYLTQTGDPAAKASPLLHYLASGGALGLSPHPLFDPAWYRRTYLDSADAAVDPLIHFLTQGAQQAFDPNPLFSMAWYRARNPDVPAQWNPLVHYVLHGADEMRDPHPVFSVSQYLRQNPECSHLGMSPLVHALTADRPGSGAPIVFGSIKPPAPAATKASPAAGAGRFSDLPRHRRYLAQIVAGASSDEAARRVVGYFGIVEHENLALDAAPEARRETLQGFVDRMRFLSESANDSRPVKVSIIVPAYNHVEYTIACVISLLEHKSGLRYEIIIGNNISADETREVFEAVGGVVRCITHQKNEGFIKNCNLSAREAVGDYIVLLNNDTFILDGWLDELMAPFERFRQVGLVGSKLLMADGSLQEAGCIMWSDASGWNFGRNQDPTAPEFNYAKDIDWASGASVAIPKSVWDDVGGFDEIYLPAYCDDSDLAFALRARGWRTMLAPASMLVHHEGITHGTDVSVGVKAYQVENQRKFVAKWSQTLVSDQHPNGENVFLARDRSGHRPHLLMVDHYIPQHDKDAGSRTMFQYCQLFVDANFQVTFWPDNLYFDAVYAKSLQDIGIEVIYGPQYVDRFPEWIAQHGRYFDYAFLSRAHVAEKYISHVRESSPAKILFYGHDLHFARLQQEYDVTKSATILEEIEYWKKVESAIWADSDVVYYPSEDEVRLISDLVPGRTVRVLTPYMYTSAEIGGTRSRLAQMQASANSILFVGGFRHRPNVDAALWLVREIMPLVKKGFPDAHLIIAGSFPPPEVMALANDDVIVTGYVSDSLLRQLYRSATVSVAPLRFGGGIKGKVIEAMRFGVPVVTTSAGTQGMAGADRFLEIGDTAVSFADAIRRLLGDAELRRQRAGAGLDYIQREYSYLSAVQRMLPDVPQLTSILVDGGALIR